VKLISWYVLVVLVMYVVQLECQACRDLLCELDLDLVTLMNVVAGSV
jgi:hypothetical protein